MWQALNRIERLCVIALIGIALLGLCLIGTYPILDKSEARYALVPLRMLWSGDWVTPTIDGIDPFWGKPPLSFWASAISMRLLGVSEFSARLPILLTIEAIIMLTVDAGRQGRDRSFGLLGGCILASMVFVPPLAGYVLTDQMLTLGITLTMVSFWRAMTTSSRTAGYLFFVGLAMTILTKGLVGLALIGPALLIWLIWNGRFAAAFQILPVYSGTALTAVLALPWYVLAELRSPGFLYYFIVGEHLMKFLKPGWTGDLYGVARAGKTGWVWPYVMIGTLPWSGTVIEAFARRSMRAELLARRTPGDLWMRYLLVWALTPLVFFTVASNGGLPYLLPSLPPIALLLAQMLRDIGRDRSRPYLISMIAVAPVIVAGVVVATHFPQVYRHAPTQKYILQQWRELRGQDQRSITYLDDKPFSADFYTLGTARQTEDMDSALQDGDQKFFAIATECLIAIPQQLRSRVEIVAESNKTALLWNRADALQSPRYRPGMSQPWPVASLEDAQYARERCTGWARYDNRFDGPS